MSQDEQRSVRVLERWGWGSIGVNVLLAGINVLVLYLSGSLAVAAEMVHNLVDLVASVAVLVGLKLSSRKSPTFPHGLYKVENVVASGVAILLFLAAYEIAKKAFFGEGSTVVVTTGVLVGVSASALIPLAFSLFQMRAGRAANSPSLMADAQEFRVHVLTSGVVFVSLLGHRLGEHPERIAALAVVIIIGKTGLNLLTASMRVLLDASLEPSVLEKARRALEEEPSVVEVTSLTGRNAGRYRLLEASVETRLHDLARAEKMARSLEHKLFEAVPFLDHAAIHVRPVHRDVVRIAIPLGETEDSVNSHFGTADRFLIAEKRREDGKTLSRTILANPFSTEPKGRGIKVAHWLVKQGIDVLGTPDDILAKGPGYALKEVGVEVIPVEVDRADAVLEHCYERAVR